MAVDNSSSISFEKKKSNNKNSDDKPGDIYKMNSLRFPKNRSGILCYNSL